MPADLSEKLIFATIGALATADVLVAVATHRVEFDSDRQFGDDNVGPHLDSPVEGRAYPHGVHRQLDRQPLIEQCPQAAFSRRRCSRGPLAAECLAGLHLLSQSPQFRNWNAVRGRDTPYGHPRPVVGCRDP